MSAVEVEASGEDVGAWESLEGELGSVGASSYGDYGAVSAGLGDGSLGDVDDVGLVLQLFEHVVVGVAELDGGGGGAVLLVDALAEVEYDVFAHLEHLAVVVAYDVGEGGLFDASSYVVEVVEAFVAGGELGDFVFGHHLGELGGDEGGVDHLVFGVAGVDVAAVYGDAGAGGVEVFVFELAYFASVDGVGPGAAELVDVEFVGSAAYLFVGIEGYTYGAVLDFGVVQEVFYGGDDLGYACFVVGSEEGVTVGDDEVFADVGFEFGVSVDFGDDVLLCVEDDVAALVVVYDLRAYVCAAEVGGGVEMGDEAYGGGFLLGGGVEVGGEGGVDVGVGVYLYVFEAKGVELVDEVSGEGPLLLGAGALVGLVFAGLGVDADVAQESFYEFVCVHMGFRFVVVGQM